MKVQSINDIKDSKVRNAVTIAESAWSKGTPFSKAIIESATFCKADVGEVTEYMLEIAKEKTDDIHKNERETC